MEGQALIDIVESSLEKEDMTCLACGDIVIGPVQCGNCGVIYCGLCVLSKIHKKCRSFICQESAMNIVKPSLFWLKLYENTVVYCRNKSKGCIEKIFIKHYINHIVCACEFRTVLCKNKGCNEKFFYNEINKHLSKDCLFALIDCPINGCTGKYTRGSIENHIKICPFAIVYQYDSISCKDKYDDLLKKIIKSQENLLNSKKIILN